MFAVDEVCRGGRGGRFGRGRCLDALAWEVRHDRLSVEMAVGDPLLFVAGKLP